MEELIRQGRIIFPRQGKFVVWNTIDELLADIRTGKGPKDGNGNQLIREGIDLIPLDFWVGKKVGFGIPAYKRYASEMADDTQPLSSWVKAASEKDFDADDGAVHIESGFTDEGSKELRRLLGDKAFPYPKPPSLIRGLVDQASGPGDIVVDFFAGSATTAQVVAELNARDAEAAGKNGTEAPAPRRWIMVSSTEATADEPGKNIARDVAARRLTALRLEYAYLRVRTAPTMAEARGLEEAWIRPSLELILGGLVGRAPDAGSGPGLIHWTSGDDFCLSYLPELRTAVLDELEAFQPPAGSTALVATFQPGPLRQRFGDRPDFRVIALPDFIIASLTGSLPGRRP
jgi:adenine-specific DNA-methyltransferase